MGKLDDMRRAREALHGGADPAEALESEATEGRCSVCRKIKSLDRGVLVNHQKGLGKMCPGSRQAPV
jgi:hypothetical protein